MYTISKEKLGRVTDILNAETDPAATEELVESEICVGWQEYEGLPDRGYQKWLDNASPQVIADWLATFYG